jgi:hypothetical protein
MGPLVASFVMLRTMAPEARVWIAVLPLLFIALAAILLVVIPRTHARWACLTLMSWALYECLKTAAPLQRGRLEFALLANVVCLIISLRAVRGSFALARMKKEATATVDAFS